MDKILISKCLTGENVKYNGGNNLIKSPFFDRLKRCCSLVPVCPEVDGGLSVPRPASEICGKKVINTKGEDVTAFFEKGAYCALETAKENNIKYALLKERSPSCGTLQIYDGSFGGKVIDGMGVTGKLLSSYGIKVYNEEKIDLLCKDIFKSKIPKNIITILSTLKSKGYEGYLVGGCVRDILMGNVPYDYDITTNATPEETIECFADYTVIPTGIKHGTVTVVSDGKNIEITTYRIDGDYKDSRHPEAVKFTRNLENDLSRRDFSMNAMAMDKDGNIVDIFGGEQAINEKTISCVGNPDTRFKEDALRILRCLRFSSTLCFDIERKTEESIFKNMHLIKNLSAERIFSEVSKLVSGKDAWKITERFYDVFREFIPEIKVNNPKEISKKIKNSKDDLYIRLAIFLENTDSDKILKRLKTDKNTAKTVKMLLENKDIAIKEEKKDIKFLLKKLGDKDFFAFLDFKCAIDKKDYDKAKSMAKEILKRKEPYRVCDLEINGKDLLNAGYKNEEISKKLNELIDMVIEEKIENDRKKLSELIKKTSE